MVKLSKSGKQYRITIPQEIISTTKWDENTELIFIPHMKKADSKLNKNTPIYIRQVD